MKATQQALLFALAACAAAVLYGCGSSGVTSVAGPTATRCQASITNSSPSFAAAGGTGTLAISVSRECAWTASTDASWIAITAGASGQGDGTVNYRVAANGDATTRRATIAVGDQGADIGQAAAACAFRISSPSNDLSATGDRAVLDVRTQNACAWQARTDAAWASVEPDAGTGEGQITVIVAANAGTARAVTIAIADTQVSLRQSSMPANPSPPPAPAPPPPPPPPPAPVPVPVDVSGKVEAAGGACPNLQFTVKGYLVKTSAATSFAGGPCKDVKNDKQVDVRGTTPDAATKIVTATAVTLEGKK